MEMLALSGIAVGQVEQRGYRTILSKTEVRSLGFSASQARVPALLIPILGVTGEIVNYQIRPDVPRVIDGKAVKYETPRKSRMVLDVPPGARAWLGDPKRPLFVTEGVKKADAAVSRDLCCVALLGVWNWRGTNEQGGKTALAEWESIALKGRTVYIVFDSDVMTKPAVHAALVRLKAFLEGRGATVFVVYLPAAAGGAKVGLDDYFVAGHTVDELLSHASPEVRESERARAKVDKPPYEIRDDGIYLRGDPLDGAGSVRLTNFGAWIAAEVVFDDGVEQTRVFRMRATACGRICEFDIPADEFDLLHWPSLHIGAGAAIYPHRGVEQHVRAAIQLVSGVEAERRRVFTHTGWIRHADAWVFLHAGGAIGRDGPVSDVEVELPGPLAQMSLPSDGDSLERRDAIHAVLRMLEIGPLRLTVPVVAAPLRVVIGDCDFSLHLVGGTGVFKTAFAALAQQVFGAALNARNLPGSWTSTSNSLETLAFHAKDVLLVVDDFAPSGGVTGLARMNAAADRLFRAQGNRAGRGRCAPDGDLRVVRMPRGLILSTGEDSPRGSSVRARVLQLPVGPGDIDRARLTEAQKDADNGLYARALSGFVRWLAPRLDATRADLMRRVQQIRAALAKDGLHRRIPGITADLLFGLECFLEFAVEVDALAPDAAIELQERAWKALVEAVGSQQREQGAAEPARRFLSLLRSAIVSGEAYLANGEGEAPPNSGAWGWRRTSGILAEPANERWQPLGKLVGWVDGDDVFLDIEAAVRCAQVLGNPTGDPLSILASTLKKRLAEAGLLKSKDPDGVHLEIQHVLSGARRRVLHLDASLFLRHEADEEGSGDPATPGPASP